MADYNFSSTGAGAGNLNNPDGHFSQPAAAFFEDAIYESSDPAYNYYQTAVDYNGQTAGFHSYEAVADCNLPALVAENAYFPHPESTTQNGFFVLTGQEFGSLETTATTSACNFDRDESYDFDLDPSLPTQFQEFNALPADETSFPLSDAAHNLVQPLADVQNSIEHNGKNDFKVDQDGAIDFQELFGETEESQDLILIGDETPEQTAEQISEVLLDDTDLVKQLARELAASSEQIHTNKEQWALDNSVNDFSLDQNVNEYATQDMYGPSAPPGGNVEDTATHTFTEDIDPELIHNRKRLQAIMAEKEISPSPQACRTSRKQARIAKVGRQPRASKGQIDALVGLASKGDARTRLVNTVDSGVQRDYIGRPTPTYPLTSTMVSEKFSAVEAAKQRLDRVGPGIKYHVFQVDDDDFHYVNNDVMNFLGNKLFEALSHQPAAAPPQIPDADKGKFDKVQTDALSRVQKALAYHELREDAKARCVLLVDTAFRLHVKGIPVADLDREKFSKGKIHASGYPVDVDSTFYLRIYKILFIVNTNKLVALDIMSGSNIDGLVRSPRECVHRKVLNFRGNDAKAKLTEIGLDAVTAQTSPQQIVDSGFSSPDANQTTPRGRKRTSAAVIDLTEPDAPKKPKALPSSTLDPSASVKNDILAMFHNQTWNS